MCSESKVATTHSADTFASGKDEVGVWVGLSEWMKVKCGPVHMRVCVCVWVSAIGAFPLICHITALWKTYINRPWTSHSCSVNSSLSQIVFISCLVSFNVSRQMQMMSDDLSLLVTHSYSLLLIPCICVWGCVCVCVCVCVCSGYECSCPCVEHPLGSISLAGRYLGLCAR